MSTVQSSLTEAFLRGTYVEQIRNAWEVRNHYDPGIRHLAKTMIVRAVAQLTELGSGPMIPVGNPTKVADRVLRTPAFAWCTPNRRRTER